ncbi:MAG TPA: hypothetical protein DHV48_10385 [Prolixibacteraceae bacterium]|nr:hypothetical protein [Prolixibacteraceae bacterium]
MDSLMNGTQSGKSIVFLYGVAIISALWIIRFWLNQELVRIKLSTIDLLLVTVVLYILLRNNREELVHSLLFFELAGLSILYFIIRQQTQQGYLLVLLALVAGGLVQAIYGNLQLWGFFPSHHGIFKMTGSFFNPGPYAGYLAAIFPISLGLYLFNFQFNIKPHSFDSILNSYINPIKFYFIKLYSTHFLYNNNEDKSSQEKHKCRIRSTDYTTMKSFFLISIISLCLVLPASRSRAAWLAIVVSSVYLLSIKYKLVQQAKAHFKTRIRRISLLASLVVLLFIVGAGLYHLKKGSANGRLLIWKVSAEMISDKPVFGHGYDGFKKYYMDYQAEYFQYNRESKEALVAGDSNYAFNELIQLTVENGLVGLFLILLLFKHAFSTPSNREASNSSSGSFRLFSFFCLRPFQSNHSNNRNNRNPSNSEASNPSNPSNSYASNPSNREASNPSNISNSEASNSSSGFFRLFSFFCLRPFQSNHSNNRNNNNRNPSNSEAPNPSSSEASPSLRTPLSHAIVLSVLVFGLFSYPSQILPIKVCLTVALAIVAGTTSQNVIIDLQAPLLLRRSFRVAIKTVAATVCLVVLWLATLQIKTIGTAYTNWKNAFDLYNIGIYTECLADYEKAYPTLKTNGDFLTNYGKALSMAEKHAEATKVLQQAARYYPNTVVYTALGDSFKKMGQTIPAEQAYLHAGHMNPSRFYPKYLLAKLYDDTGQKEKAIQVANELLAKDIKVESTAIEEIKEEMKKLITKSK